MINNSNPLPYPTGRTVAFPYENPYEQQIAFMDAILTSLNDSDSHLRTQSQQLSTTTTSTATTSTGGCRVWMLESPTGTGKSLSLACALLAWLHYQEQHDMHVNGDGGVTKDTNNNNDTGTDWLDDWESPLEIQQEQERQFARDQSNQARLELEQALQTIRQETQKGSRDAVLRSALATVRQKATKKRPRQQPTTLPQLELLEYRSSDENDTYNNNTRHDLSEFATTTTIPRELSPTAALLRGINKNNNRKIVYAARTHTQLSQFVRELQRTNKTTRVVALGSRTTLCGNASVKKLSGAQQMNDACLELKKTRACDLYDDNAINTLALHALAQPTDIEEAARLGSIGAGACAYYASRAALAAAQVVVVPYSMLLCAKTRASVGLSLTGAIVVVDEAHNVPEALRALHATRLVLPVVRAASEQLSAYVNKYVDRLAGRNLHYIGQIRKLLLAMEKYLDKAKRMDRMMTPTELVIELKMDNVNLFKILRYMEHSRLSQKLLGFTNHKTKDVTSNAYLNASDDVLSKHVSAMSIVESFFEKMTCSSKEGKIVVDVPSAPGSSSRIQHAGFRYVLLNPAAFFENVLEEAHALALIGGTLRPFVHVAAELLGEKYRNGDLLRDAQAADEAAKSTNKVSCSFVTPNFTAFTCDHVVPASNVLLQCVSTGPAGRTLDFRHETRSTDAVCDELGDTLLHVCQVVPNGVVVFLPSYAYEAHLTSRWQRTGLWQKLKESKRIHREPKSSQNVEASLQAYSKDTAKGALLLSVIGGKLSEGINFSNEMARCVLVVGLPYPDITDPELKEKMASMDSAGNQSISGQAYYHNLCMRAVNQSVGRAIRHANDYAAILLVDGRYQSEDRVWSALSPWLKRGVDKYRQRPIAFAEHVQGLTRFFDSKRGS
jgi:chromosome transmission fidelity protein 1